MNQSTRKWRVSLTKAEKRQLNSLDRKIKEMAARIAILRMQRNKIQNRATARAV